MFWKKVKKLKYDYTVNFKKLIMKKIVLIVLSIATLWGCKNQETKTETPLVAELEPISDQVLETSVIYEVNIRDRKSVV